MTNTLEERTNDLEPTGNIQETYNLFLLRSDKKITPGQFTEVPIPTIVTKLVAAMALSEKQNEGLIFDNRTGAMVKYILPDDKVKKSFNKIDRNIA